jgi:glyoxylase-like metal-dependent hydrolase (beta-lactamase superfamily II)
VALWSEQKHILLLGDAVLGSGVPGYDGNLSMPPTHQFIADYLRTLDRLDQLKIGIALTGHWNPLDEKEFKNLIANSRECVHRDLSFVQGCVAKGPKTFTELLEAFTQSFRAWPEDASIHYFYALSGYLDYLAAKGELTVENSVVRTL